MPDLIPVSEAARRLGGSGDVAAETVKAMRETARAALDKLEEK